MGSFDLPISGNFLYHSLQDNPNDRTYQTNSTEAKKFSVTRSYTEISIRIAKIIDRAAARGESGVGESHQNARASISNAGLDWYLAINNYNYDWAAFPKGNGQWTVYIGIHDRYDYHNIEGAEDDYFDLVKLVNNDAYRAQQAGAIVPYYISIFREQNYTP